MKRQFSIAIFALVLAFALFEHAVVAQIFTSFPLGFPTAPEYGNQVLTLAEVRKIASHQARVTWGEAFRIAEIPCVDLNDSLIAYQVVFRLADKDRGKSGDDDEQKSAEESYRNIQQKVKKGRELLRAASEKLRVAERQMRKRTDRKTRK